MSESSTGRFTDAADYRASVSDVLASLTPTDPGGFSAHVARITLHRLRLLEARECLPRIAYVTLPPGVAAVSFSVDRTLPLVCRGTPLPHDEIMLHRGGDRQHQRTDGPCHWGMIALPVFSLEDHYKTETGGSLLLPDFSQILHPAPSDRKALLRVHREAARVATQNPRLLDHQAVVKAMEYELAGQIVRGLVNAEIRPDGPSARRDAEIMSGVEDILAADLNRAFTPGELAETLGVSSRTLQTICRSCLGIGTHRYIELRRLQRARSAILHADPRTARIADLVRSAGFGGVGRFAALYRTVFGEAPATTLRRPGEGL